MVTRLKQAVFFLLLALSLRPVGSACSFQQPQSMRNPFNLRVPCQPNATFFHFMWDYPSLQLQHLCAIERALRAFPEMTVRVYTHNVSKFVQEFPSEEIVSLPLTGRLEVVPFTADTIYSGTPLDKWFASKAYANSSYPRHIKGDAARLAVLYKYGGIYLDLDAIPINPQILCFPNSFAQQVRQCPADWGQSFNGHYIALQRRHPLLLKMMEDFQSNYMNKQWGIVGPGLMTRTFLRCEKTNPAECEGLVVLPYPTSTGLHWDDVVALRKSSNTVMLNRIIYRTMVLHHSNNGMMKDCFENSSLFLQITQRFCPVCHDMFAPTIPRCR